MSSSEPLHDTKRYYDDFAGWYERERHHGYHAMIDRLELDVVRPLARNSRVLEVGCGTGLILRGLATETQALTGLDLSRGMLAEARRRGFRVVEGSATCLPFADASFDLVYSFKVLAHVPDIRTAFSEMARVTRPGGHVVAELYNRHSLRRLAKRLGGPGRISQGRSEDEVFTRWDAPDEILGYLPPSLSLEGWRGVRVLTPAASVFKLPLMGRIVPRLERLALDSPLARYGGFLVAVCRKS